jgi:aminoglycoside phosphotransferase (APT) family kinase protein
LSQYTKLQRTWANHTRDLHAVGCRVADVPLEPFDWVPEARRRLAHFDIPLSVDHGDFWPSNVFVTRARSTIIDWTDAAIGHPFFSLLPMRLAFGFDRRRSGLDCLRDAYLEPWAEGSDLKAAFDVAQPLAALYYAAKLRALQPHNQWWLSRFVPWLFDIANREAASLVW